MTAVVACGIALIGALAHGTEVLGKKPGYLTFGPSSVPNEQAITKMIWVPGLDNALKNTVGLSGEVKGSFIDFDGTDLWVGVYDKEASKSKIYRFPLTILDEFNRTRSLTEDRALTALAVPAEAQGAAFDRDGNLWITSSSSRFGMLYKLNPKTGEKLASYEMVVGIEDIGFDAEGKLWSVSEAGSQRWSRWSTLFPILFRLDVSRLK